MSSIQLVTKGPIASIAFTPVFFGKKPGFEATVAFRPAQIVGCDSKRLTFEVLHPATHEKVGQLIFSTGSNDSVLVDAKLFNGILQGNLTRVKRSKHHPGTVWIGCEGAERFVSLSSTIPDVWLRICLDDLDEDAPRRTWRRRPSRVRFTIAFPADARV